MKVRKILLADKTSDREPIELEVRNTLGGLTVSIPSAGTNSGEVALEVVDGYLRLSYAHGGEKILSFRLVKIPE
jgi:hypothetical protein